MRSLGVDLRDLFADESALTPRYVLWLVEWLPDDAAIYASQQGGPKHRGWTVDRHVAVTTLDVLRWANYQRAEGKGGKPKPIQRPKLGKPKRRTVTVAELNGKG